MISVLAAPFSVDVEVEDASGVLDTASVETEDAVVEELSRLDGSPTVEAEEESLVKAEVIASAVVETAVVEDASVLGDSAFVEAIDVAVEETSVLVGFSGVDVRAEVVEDASVVTNPASVGTEDVVATTTLSVDTGLVLDSVAFVDGASELAVSLSVPLEEVELFPSGVVNSLGFSVVTVVSDEFVADGAVAVIELVVFDSRVVGAILLVSLTLQLLESSLATVELSGQHPKRVSRHGILQPNLNGPTAAKVLSGQHPNGPSVH